jgi:hypothetical protein
MQISSSARARLVVEHVCVGYVLVKVAMPVGPAAQSYKLDLSRQVFFFLTHLHHNRRKNDPQDLKKKWSRKMRPAFLYNL